MVVRDDANVYVYCCCLVGSYKKAASLEAVVPAVLEQYRLHTPRLGGSPRTVVMCACVPTHVLATIADTNGDRKVTGNQAVFGETDQKPYVEARFPLQKKCDHWT